MALHEKKNIYIVYVTKNDRIIQKNLLFFPQLQSLSGVNALNKCGFKGFCLFQRFKIMDLV